MDSIFDRITAILRLRNTARIEAAIEAIADDVDASMTWYEYECFSLDDAAMLRAAVGRLLAHAERRGCRDCCGLPGLRRI
jgi:hypothetical protein